MILGIGCDIVEIKRITKSIDKPVIDKILTAKEKEMAMAFPIPRRCEWIAGRFAAKEAIYKAIHQLVDCQISDIEVVSDAQGAPCCHCFPYDIMISIAHEKEYAIAYALVQMKES